MPRDASPSKKAPSRTIRAEAPPDGLTCLESFLDRDEEHDLITSMSALAFNPVVMKGVAAKRTTIHYGWDYGYESWRVEPAEPTPSWLHPLRSRVAKLLAIEPDRLEEVLLTRYPPGAGIGWHRDAPMFGDVAGVSLASDCSMKFRRRTSDGFLTWTQSLPGRSLYIIRGEARTQWQHSITATAAERYSITFRTMRRRS